MNKTEALILEIRKTNNEEKKKELLYHLTSPQELKNSQAVIFQNAWLDIFPEIIQSHKDFFCDYFHKRKVQETFRDYILSEFVKVMHFLESTKEEDILAFSLWDESQNNEGLTTYTRNLFAKNYYLGIKIANPEFAKEIFRQTVDRYLVNSIGKGESYYNTFEKLTTDYGKMILVTQIMEHLNVEETTIDIMPVLEYKKDLLSIFKKCLEDRNQNLIYFVGEYLEYIIMFPSTNGVLNFKEEISQLLDQYEKDEMIKAFRDKTYL